MSNPMSHCVERALLFTACVSTLGAGCEPSLGPWFETRLTEKMACGNMSFFATNERQTIQLVAAASGLTSDAIDAVPTPTTAEYELAGLGSGAAMAVVEGEHLLDGVCTDVTWDGGPVFDHIWLA